MMIFWLRHYRHGMLDLTIGDPSQRTVFIWCGRCNTGRYSKATAAGKRSRGGAGAPVDAIAPTAPAAHNGRARG
jgi:hypothetical protein